MRLPIDRVSQGTPGLLTVSLSVFYRCLIGFFVVLGMACAVAAEDAKPAVPESVPPAPLVDSAKPMPPAKAADAPNLGQSQQAVQRDFERFEKSLYSLAEFTRRADPDRAELLGRARSHSQEHRILSGMDAVARLLQESGYGEASARQDDLIEELQVLLKILQSEDERARLAREIARLQDLIKDTNKLISGQKDVLGDSQRSPDPSKHIDPQKKLADGTKKLEDKIERQDAQKAGENKPGAAKPGESKPGEPKPGEPKKPGEEKKPSEAKPGEPKPGEPKPGEPKPGEPKPGEPKPGEGKPGPPKPPSPPSPPGNPKTIPPMSPPEIPPGPPPALTPQPPMPPTPPQAPPDPKPQRTPGKEELEKAREKMERAIEELRKKSKEGSAEQQNAALAQLELLKAKLEEILRQLREEEKELLLTMLEARFQKMLKLQLQINAETVRIDKIPNAERQERHSSKSLQLSRDERENVIDATKALTLLREEGSSVAFPEAVEQIRDYMESVADRLERTDTAATTQLLETMIVETLDEMISALQKELEKLKDKKKKKGQPGEPPDPKLVEMLAELKMIRALESQIYRLTKQVGMEIEGEQAVNPEHLKLTENLGRRQQRLQRATYDLHTGKNK